jgi:hypothetical protein
MTCLLASKIELISEHTRILEDNDQMLITAPYPSFALAWHAERQMGTKRVEFFTFNSITKMSLNFSTK